MRKKAKRRKMEEKIRLNKRFYEKIAVEEAAKDFSHLAKFRIIDSKENIIIVIEETKKTPQLKEEFINYVLGLMKNKTIV